MSMAWRQCAAKGPSEVSLLAMASPSRSPAESLSAKKKSRNYCVKAQELLTKLQHCWVPVLPTAGISQASLVVAKGS